MAKDHWSLRYWLEKEVLPKHGNNPERYLATGPTERLGQCIPSSASRQGPKAIQIRKPHHQPQTSGLNLSYMKYISYNMKLSDEMLTEISYVNMSVYRTRVMKSLDKMPKIPRQLADDTDINIHHVSNTLTKLKEHELVECINPEMRKGRVYRLTDKGEELAKNIDYLNK